MMDMLLSKYEITQGAIELHLTLPNKSRAFTTVIYNIYDLILKNQPYVHISYFDKY